jgi:hypothetical protein
VPPADGIGGAILYAPLIHSLNSAVFIMPASVEIFVIIPDPQPAAESFSKIATGVNQANRGSPGIEGFTPCFVHAVAVVSAGSDFERRPSATRYDRRTQSVYQIYYHVKVALPA